MDAKKRTPKPDSQEAIAKLRREIAIREGNRKHAAWLASPAGEEHYEWRRMREYERCVSMYPLEDLDD